MESFGGKKYHDMFCANLCTSWKLTMNFQRAFRIKILSIYPKLPNLPSSYYCVYNILLETMVKSLRMHKHKCTKDLFKDSPFHKLNEPGFISISCSAFFRGNLPPPDFSLRSPTKFKEVNIHVTILSHIYIQPFSIASITYF